MNQKGILEFELDDPDARNAWKRAVLADNVYAALEEISDKIFRPHRKHGYPDQKIQKYINDLEEKLKNGEENPILEVIALLEENFRDILTEHGITLE